jgi:polyisoprenyl-teichoic acid--peptidoglycan teichoic acid transferase
MAQKKFDFAQNLRTYKRPTTGQFILTGVGLVLAIALFIFLRSFVSCWRLTSLPGIPLPTCPNPVTQPITNAQGTPIAGTATPTLSAPQAPLPLPWDGASRITVLLIGLDYRDWVVELGAPRSDTMILLTIDPVSMTAGSLSIPRDMWANIPGFGYSKINNAYSFGQSYRLPGGGPALAMKTVEAFLGIPIQYFAQVDFQTFEKIVDGIGGICIDVPYEIIIDPLGPHNTATLEAGYECINGSEALAYARNRHTEGGDVDRSKRQQQVMMAIRDRVLNPANFPNLIAQAPALYANLSSGIHTNMSLDDALRLAVLARGINPDNIQNGTIDYTMMQDAKYDLNGQVLDVLRPYPDKIRDLVDKIFGGGAMKPMAVGDPTQLMQQEAARVIVVNASGVDGIASKTSDYLKAQGMNVVNFGNTSDYPDKYYYPPLPDRTMLIVHSGKPYAMEYLRTLMKFSAQNQFVVDFDPNAPADIILAVGADWAYDSPMP